VRPYFFIQSKRELNGFSGYPVDKRIFLLYNHIKCG